ncbi:phosphotransferase [Bradyrhizobium sp. STM 3562]|uniref:phosphotransferase n=1 Tax=Bradyrhizobium sp. STM 3562 TaxID=578924 RepID=UPI0038902464
MDEADIPHRAALAAAIVAARFTAARVEPVILHQSRHITVLLRPLAIVARVVVVNSGLCIEALNRELQIARHLGARGAPIVRSSQAYPAGPHVHEQFAMTLWLHVEHLRTDDDDDVERLASAARALRRVHEALADYPHWLPSYRAKIDECGALLGDRSALAAMANSDRNVLLKIYDHLICSLDNHPVRPVPIHGDAHLGNVLFAAEGPLWTDFDAVSLGPREWDIGCVPDLAAFEPIDHELFTLLSLIRSVCVSTWCWAVPRLPGKLEAAKYHLEYLKAHLGGRHL